MAVKILTARQAADLVPDGANFATNGFIGASFPEEIAIAVEQRFLETGKPKDLTLLFCAAQGDAKDKGCLLYTSSSDKADARIGREPIKIITARKAANCFLNFISDTSSLLLNSYAGQKPTIHKSGRKRHEKSRF